jgi:CDP-diacylglycerol---glycerol-3-phosphate 3-phosphatidyltransferase
MNAPLSNQIWNVPNVLTLLRLILSIGVFALLPWNSYVTTWAAFALFTVAAATDWIDGYWARRFNQITQLGRIFDPFVDKILICGTYVMLAVEQRAADQPFGITGWMAVVVLGREMLVTALRSFLEQSGADFSAKWAGKWKMVLQCLAVGAAMVCLLHFHKQIAIPEWLYWTQLVSAWGAVLLTLYSGMEYVFVAARWLNNAAASHK